MASGKLVKLERSGDLDIVLLDKPPVNAIDLGLLLEAEEILAEIMEDREARAMVITGRGKAFSAGLDLKAVVSYTPAELRDTINAINRVVMTLYSFPLPTVAAINGHAIAGGFILAISCDYRICADADLKVGITEVRAGVPFPIATLEVLKAELSPTVARWMTLLGRNIGPSEALDHGILDELVAPDRVMPRAMEVARSLGETPPESYQRIKSQLHRETVERIENIIGGEGDPLLKEWITEETKEAAPILLAEEKMRGDT
jgi:enoyl-CoA hydratase